MMRDASDVQRTADQLRIAATLHESLEASTVNEAADSLGVDADAIGKSIVLMVAEEAPVVVIVRGSDEVDMAKVGEHVDADPDAVRMAKPDEVETYTGFPVGGVPPIGHERPLRTLIDQRLFDQETVYVGGGSEDSMMEVQATDLKKLPDVSTGDFARS